MLCELERVLVIRLLKEDIPALARESISGPIVDLRGLSARERLFIVTWRRLKAHLANRRTWTGMLYLFLRFPLGIASFTIAVTLIALTFALLGAPFYYGVDDGIELGIWKVDTLWEALILTIAGLSMVFISLHAMNGTAFLSGKLARVMLGKLD